MFNILSGFIKRTICLTKSFIQYLKKNTFDPFFAAGMRLTALLRFIATGGGGVEAFFGDSSFPFGAAVTVIPRVANMFATALASDLTGLCGFGGGFRTDNVMESDRCITLSAGSGVPPCKIKSDLVM